MPYVYSTLTNDQNYTLYEPFKDTKNLVIQKRSQVLIKGGANRITKALITPLGIATRVTDDQLLALQQNPSFEHHVDNGYIIIKNDETNPDKVAASMAGRDESSPLVEQDFKEEDEAKPVDDAKKKKIAKGK